MNLFVCRYLVLNAPSLGGGSILISILVPLYAGLNMYCFMASRDAPAVRETTPDLTVSAGKSVWSSTYHEPRHHDAQRMPVATWMGREDVMVVKKKEAERNGAFLAGAVPIPEHSQYQQHRHAQPNTRTAANCHSPSLPRYCFYGRCTCVEFVPSSTRGERHWMCAPIISRRMQQLRGIRWLQENGWNGRMLPQMPIWKQIGL